MHERIIIPESVFSVAEAGSEYVTAVREMDLDEIIGRASLMTDFMYSLAFDNNSALAERTLRPFPRKSSWKCRIGQDAEQPYRA